MQFLSNFIQPKGECLDGYFDTTLIKTRTKVVHKNASQGCNYVEGLTVKKSKKKLNNIKVTFQ